MPGRQQWFVQLDSLVANRRLCFDADLLEIHPSGALVAKNVDGTCERVIAVFAPGQWSCAGPAEIAPDSFG